MSAYNNSRRPRGPNHRRRQPLVAKLFAIIAVVAFAFTMVPAQGSPPSGASVKATETIATAPAAFTIAALGLTIVAIMIVAASQRTRKMFIGTPATRVGPDQGIIKTFALHVENNVRHVTSQISAAYRKSRRRPRAFTPVTAGNPPGVVMIC